jgi:hypothetical protein
MPARGRHCSARSDDRPSNLSEVFSKFETQTRNEVKDMSPNQLKRWKNGYVLAVTDLISVIGDKPLTNISHSDVFDYVDWLEGRIETSASEAIFTAIRVYRLKKLSPS